MLETDKALVYYSITPEDSQLALALKQHKKNIEQATGTPLKVLDTGVVSNGNVEAVIAEMYVIVSCIDICAPDVCAPCYMSIRDGT